MASKAEKRRMKAAARAEKAGLPELKGSKKRDKSNCFVERVRQQEPDPDPQRVATAKRCRDAGLDPHSAVDRQRAAAPHYEGAHGQAMLAVAPDDAARLHYVWRELSKAYSVYMRLVMGARSGADSYAREAVSTPAAAEAERPDPRTLDERVAAARERWFGWVALISFRIKTDHNAALWRQIQGIGAPVFADGKVTGAGRAFVEALAALADVVEREGK